MVHLATAHRREDNRGNVSVNHLIAVHEDGSISSYSEDLQTRDWSAGNGRDHTDQDLNTRIHVEFAKVLSFEQIKKAILRSRGDLVAKVETGSSEYESSFLLILCRSRKLDDPGGHSELNLQILGLSAPNVGPNTTSTTICTLQELASLAIPEPRSLHSESSRFTLQVTSGSLYQFGGKSLVIYDLTGSTPTLSDHLKLDASCSSCLQISHDLIAYCTSRTLSIVNSKYHSLQDSYTFLETSKMSDNEDKSKTSTEESTIGGDSRLITYFAPLELLIALQGQKVQAIPLSRPFKQDGVLQKRKRDTLAASIGKGYSLSSKRKDAHAISERRIKSLGIYLPQMIATSQSSKEETELDPRSSNFNSDLFQDTLLKALESGDAHSNTKKGQHIIDDSSVYLFLRRIFDVSVETVHIATSSDTQATHKLKVLFLQRNICNALIKAGFFTAHYVEVAMKQYGAMPFTSKLRAGALVQALAEWEPSLETLYLVLSSNLPLSSRELVHVLAIVIRDGQIATLSQDRDTTKLITDGGAGKGSDFDITQHGLTNGEAVNHPLSPGPNYAEPNYRIINAALRRLHEIPSLSIIEALRIELSTHQLRILVDILRTAIAQGGWLALYVVDQATNQHNIQDNAQICHVTHLLNCVIDSIGTSGWLLGSFMNDDFTETADTLGYMRAEISAALEGIEEAMYLKGMLGEILLCSNSHRQTTAIIPLADRKQNPTLPIKPLTLADNAEYSNRLPLGLKLVPPISTTKVGAGGELIKRSARDIGRLKSGAVGKYSFDRIII